MDNKEVMENLEPVMFYNCQDKESLKLKQEIDEEACENDDIEELTTVFLEVRHFSYLENCRGKVDTVKLIKLFLNNLDEPYTKYIVSEPYIENWQKLNEGEAKIRMISLLTGGISGLTQVFYPVEIAIDFVDRLVDWIGNPAIFLTNMFRQIIPLDKQTKSYPYIVSSASGYDLFPFPCSSEGVIFISENKIGILWCFGCD